MDVSCSRCVQAFLQNLISGVEVKLLTQDILSYLSKVFFMGFDNFKEFRQHPNFTGVAVYFLSHQPVVMKFPNFLLLKGVVA